MHRWYGMSKVHRCRLSSAPEGVAWPEFEASLRLSTAGLATIEPATRDQADREARLTLVSSPTGKITQADLPPVRVSVEESEEFVGFYVLEHSPWWVTTGGREIMHAPGELLIAAPGPLRALSRARGLATGLWVAADRLTVSRRDLDRLRRRPTALPPALRTLLTTAADSLAESGELDVLGAENYLTGLADLVVRSQLGRATGHEPKQVRKQQIREYIQQRLDDPSLDVDSIAAAHHISRSALYQIFEDEDGVAGYVRRRRLVRAKEMLADPRRTNETIGAIARQAGFTSHAHFSRVFTRTFGARPSEFRGG
ncbi:helix-turn-helix transcriptional regulator [Saccharothrix sp. AJ9571]|nr:helix-turn-helix transcriptional regulator [Saccharothrix sp. AJ9571]